MLRCFAWQHWMHTDDTGINLPCLLLSRLGLQVLEKHQEPVWPTDARPPPREPLVDFQEDHIGLQGSGLVAAREAAAQIEVMLAWTGQEACLRVILQLLTSVTRNPFWPKCCTHVV